MILNIRTSALPRSLRESPVWFVTGHLEHDSGMKKVEYSPRTLTGLNFQDVTHFSDLACALQTVEDHFWLDGVSLKIAPPYSAIRVLNALTPGGTLPKRLRDFMVRLGGYWERCASSRDVVGIIKTTIPLESGPANYRGEYLFVITNGKTAIAGKPIADLAGDPDMTNQAIVEELRAEILKGVANLIEVIKNSTAQQLGLFPPGVSKEAR